MDKGAPRAIAAVVLGAVELLTQLGLVVLWYIDPFLELMAAMSKRALKFKKSVRHLLAI